MKKIVIIYTELARERAFSFGKRPPPSVFLKIALDLRYENIKKRGRFNMTKQLRDLEENILIQLEFKSKGFITDEQLKEAIIKYFDVILKRGTNND